MKFVPPGVASVVLGLAKRTLRDRSKYPDNHPLYIERKPDPDNPGNFLYGVPGEEELEEEFEEEDVSAVHSDWEESTPVFTDTREVETWVVWSDVHIWDHDEAALRAAKKFLLDVRPNLILNGDFSELQCFSKHGDLVNPGQWKEERRMIKRELYWLRDILPDKEIIYIEGNHETRLKRYLARNAPVLSGTLSLETELDLDKLGIPFVPEEQAYDNPTKLGRLTVVHGWWFNDNAAKKHLMAMGDVLVGHVHRPGMHSMPMGGRTGHGYVAPCLRKLNPGYQTGKQGGWAHGFCVVNVWPNQEYQNTMIIMTKDRQFSYGGKVYGP